jgi:hypothetical protein
MEAGQPEDEPSRRQFYVCLALVILGGLVMAAGIFVHGLATEVRVVLVVAGFALAWTFGTRAAGARRNRLVADKDGSFALETDYTAPKPTRLPERLLELPRSRRPQHPPRSGDTEPDED